MPTNNYTSWYNWVITNVVVPIDNCVATPLNNTISFWDIIKYHFTPSEDHPYGNPFPNKDHLHESPFSKTFLLIIPIVAINYLLNRYEQARAKEEGSDQYLFTQLYDKLYDEDERETHRYLYGVAYYYNDSMPWLIRKFRFLKGYFFRGEWFDEGDKKLKDPSLGKSLNESLIKLRAQLLTKMVDLRNKREPDTWYVKDKDHNPKISMTEKVFDKKLGKAFKKAQAEQSENENQRLARKIKEAESQLDKYKNDYQYQLITELLSFSERESVRLTKEIKESNCFQAKKGIDQLFYEDQCNILKKILEELKNERELDRLTKEIQEESDTFQVREEADKLLYLELFDSLKKILEELKNERGLIPLTKEIQEKNDTFRIGEKSDELRYERQFDSLKEILEKLKYERLLVRLIKEIQEESDALQIREEADKLRYQEPLDSLKKILEERKNEIESIQLNKKTQKKSDTPQVREEADELRYKWWLDSLKEILEKLKYERQLVRLIKEIQEESDALQISEEADKLRYQERLDSLKKILEELKNERGLIPLTKEIQEESDTLQIGEESDGSRYGRRIDSLKEILEKFKYERGLIRLNKEIQESVALQIREKADKLRYQESLDSLKKISEELKKGKISFTYEDKEKLFTFLEKSEDQESKAACNRLAYIQALCDIKKREITELEKQSHRGWMSAVGSFIEDHLIRDIATASFVFWIGYFLALCATGSAPIAVIVATLYLVLMWTSKLYNYFGRSNAREKSEEEIKEKLISEQWRSEELESLTLDEEIKKLNYLLELKSVRAQMLERKETWIYVDSILEGFVRGSFAPFFILWFSTTMAGWAASYFFGIAVLINPFVSAILTTAVLFLAIGYGIYKAVNYYKETRRDIDRLREKFHNEKVEQYDRVINKLCDDLEAQCTSVLNDSSADLQKALKIKIENERDELKKKVYLFLGSEQSDQIVDEVKESFKIFIKENSDDLGEKKEKLNKLFDSEFDRLKSIQLNPEQQPKQNESSFWLKVKLAFIFLTAAGSGILFLKLLAMGVALAWCPAAYIGIAVVGLLVVGGLLYGAWDVWKNYRLLDEQSKEKTPVLFPWTDTVSLDSEKEVVVDLEKQTLVEETSVDASTSTNKVVIPEKVPSTLDQAATPPGGNLYSDLSKDENYNNLSVNAMINGGFLSKQSKKIEEEIQQNTETINCAM